MENIKTNPDELLRAIKAEEASAAGKKEGRLKVFLGYSAGVGKTYSMLEEAAMLKKAGRDVVIGIVETHKRAETAKLTEGFERITPRKIEYSGITLEEFDLDGALKRRPALVLVDELAHTNAPGSRHGKRFQDVEELLTAGINVLTTLNIQHIDGLNDVVFQLTGVKVSELVPDKMLLNAEEIELVDLTPEKLLERLKEGKVYIPERAEKAMERFFRVDNLVALRELSLNYTARRVDDKFRTENPEGMKSPWLMGSRLLVAVSPTRTSETLIRYTNRIADDLNAEWYAVYIEDPNKHEMSGVYVEQLKKNLNLAEELGAKVERLSSGNVAELLAGFAKENGINTILIGASGRPRIEEFFKGSILHDLVRLSGSVNVFVVGENNGKEKKVLTNYYSRRKWLFRPYLISLFSLAVMAALGWMLKEMADPVSLGMLLLLPVIVSGIIGGVRVGLFSSVVAVLAYDFFFVPPVLTFRIADIKYLPSFFVFIAISVTISYLAKVVRLQAAGFRFKDRFISAINSFSSELLASDTESEVLNKAARKMKEVFNNEVAILLPGKDRALRVRANTEKGAELGENDRAIALWAYMNDEEAGRKTGTLSSSKWYFVPITTKEKTAIGVVCLKPLTEEEGLTQEQRTLLGSFLNLIAMAVTNLKDEQI